MAYDLAVSKNFEQEDNPIYLGHIEPDDYPLIEQIAERTGFNFFKRLLDPYKDETFGLGDLEQAQSQLLELIVAESVLNERNLLYKLMAIVSFAISKNSNLYGVAD